MNRFRKAIVEGNVDALAALLPSPYINTYVCITSLFSFSTQVLIFFELVCQAFFSSLFHLYYIQLHYKRG